MGEAAKEEYVTNWVLTDKWPDFKFPPRHPVLPPKGADRSGGSDDSSDDGSGSEGREWLPPEERQER